MQGPRPLDTTAASVDTSVSVTPPEPALHNMRKSADIRLHGSKGPWSVDDQRWRRSLQSPTWKFESLFRLAAAGDLARLNVGRRGHLSFEDGRVERLLHLRHRPSNKGVWTSAIGQVLTFARLFHETASWQRSHAAKKPLHCCGRLAYFSVCPGERERRAARP
jgi:hypothetical protein